MNFNKGRMRFLTAALFCVLTPIQLDSQIPITTEGFLTSPDNARIYYRIYGTTGDTVVFLHGGPGGNLEVPIEGFLPLAQKHVLIAYDQRGGGRSTAPDSLSINVEQHVADLEFLREQLRIPRMTLFGHSWGGTVALFYAAKYPARARRMILHGPMPPAKMPFDKERSDSLAAAVARLCAARSRSVQYETRDSVAAACRNQSGITLQALFHDTAKIKLDKARAARQASGVPGITSLANRMSLKSLGNWDLRPLMKEVATPTLVVNGAHAPIALDQHRVWTKTMPNARLLLVPDSGHETGQFENPGFFFRAIEEFVTGTWPPSAER